MLRGACPQSRSGSIRRSSVSAFWYLKKRDPFATRLRPERRNMGCKRLISPCGTYSRRGWAATQGRSKSPQTPTTSSYACRALHRQPTFPGNPCSQLDSADGNVQLPVAGIRLRGILDGPSPQARSLFLFFLFSFPLQSSIALSLAACPSRDQRRGRIPKTSCTNTP